MERIIYNRRKGQRSLDYCFLGMYMQPKASITYSWRPAHEPMLSSRKNFTSQQPSEDLMVLEFSQLGFIGKMFKSPDLSLTWSSFPCSTLELALILWVKA